MWKGKLANMVTEEGNPKFSMKSWEVAMLNCKERKRARKAKVMIIV